MYGLLGEKLGHSFSKEIHESLNQYKYNLIEVKQEDLDLFLKERRFKALNVTIPYKEKVIPYLYFVDENAQKIGAVNTIINKDGKLYGYNTDYLGLKSLLKKENIDVLEKKVLILGTGGTAKTASVLVKDLGAKEVYKVSRSPKDTNISYDEAVTIHSDANVIINTTPCGMYPNDDLVIKLDAFKNLEAIVDVIYNPINTRLMREAKSKNIKAVNGLYMLVSQAIYASNLFLGIDEAVEEKINKVYKQLMNKKLNIVFIGMPSCGKTTIASIISEKLNKQLKDTDKNIENIIGMPISSFLNKDNEQQFRAIETSVVEEVSKLNNVVVSTGGGVIKNEYNITCLKRNGIIIFIDRPLDLLQATSTRPLSSNKNDLEKLYSERYDLYLKYSDYVVKNDSDIENVINKILEVYYENIGN